MILFERKHVTNDEEYRQDLINKNHLYIFGAAASLFLSFFLWKVIDMFHLQLSDFDASELTVGCWMILFIMLESYFDNCKLLKDAHLLHTKRIEERDERNKTINSYALNITAVVIMAASVICMIFGMEVQTNLSQIAYMYVIGFLGVYYVSRFFLKRKM